MGVLKVHPRFYPIRLTANMRNSVELTIRVENDGEEILWTECDVSVPEALSLAPDRSLLKGRLRVGIIEPKNSRIGRCKIYASARSYPSIYVIKLTAYGYGSDGTIVVREDTKTELRCESIS